MLTEELDFMVKPRKLSEFIEILVDYEIDNEILGQTEDKYLIIHLEFDEDNEEAIEHLMELAEVVETEEIDED